MIAGAAPEEFFPVIRQALMDAYRVEAILLKPPYADSARADSGIRRLVWGEYTMPLPAFPAEKSAQYRCVLVESKLGFKNLVFALSDEARPLLLCISAFLDRPASRMDVIRIMRANGIGQERTAMLCSMYDSLPVADYRDLALFTGHMLLAFMPDFEVSEIVRLNFEEEAHEAVIDEEGVQTFKAEKSAEMNRRLNDCCRAIADGSPQRAVAAIKSMIEYPSGYERHVMPADIRRDFSRLNTFILSRVLETAVPAYSAEEQYRSIDQKIQKTDSVRELERLAFEMARQYALLVKRFSQGEYSYLIRGVCSYIEQHLAEELTLAALSEHFGKNPSYLSALFSKEVGTPLSEYVAKRRIDEAVRLFNSTGMSVSDVAYAVGIPDFSYFSKQFKKFAGDSPREYRKKLGK